MKYPFEASFREIMQNPEPFIDAVFSSLESEFLTIPKGIGFIEYPVFEKGYEALKSATVAFSELTFNRIFSAALSRPISVIVLRTMLGFTPPEWAYIATERTKVDVPQGFVRTLDRKIRMAPDKPLKLSKDSTSRLRALIETACTILTGGAPDVAENQLHRLEKADTQKGLDSIRNVATLGVPYAMLLYERFLGRPFAGHRDSVSEIVGDCLESAVEDVLTGAGISFRKTKRAERLLGFDQAPDFIIPSEVNPRVIIEAKITEDDGTARDKVTRIQHLGELSLAGRRPDDPKYEVIACISGRGFSVRREDMKKMITATRGKVFTAKTLDRLIDCSRLSEFKTK